MMSRRGCVGGEEQGSVGGAEAAEGGQGGGGVGGGEDERRDHEGAGAPSGGGGGDGFGAHDVGAREVAQRQRLRARGWGRPGAEGQGADEGARGGEGHDLDRDGQARGGAQQAEEVARGNGRSDGGLRFKQTQMFTAIEPQTNMFKCKCECTRQKMYEYM